MLLFEDMELYLNLTYVSYLFITPLWLEVIAIFKKHFAWDNWAIFTRNTQNYMWLCAIWYHLYNFKNVKNTHGGIKLLVKVQASPPPIWNFSWKKYQSLAVHSYY